MLHISFVLALHNSSHVSASTITRPDHGCGFEFGSRVELWSVLLGFKAVVVCCG